MNDSTSARKVIDIIDSQSYEAGYAAGYSEAEDYKKRARKLKQLKIQEKRRRLYFLKQKVTGVFLLVLTIFAVKLLDGDATIALLTVPLGLALIFSREKCLVDGYYFENEGECDEAA